MEIRVKGDSKNSKDQDEYAFSVFECLRTLSNQHFTFNQKVFECDNPVDMDPIYCM